MTEARPERVRRGGTLRCAQGLASVRRAAMVCAVLALAGRVRGQDWSCNPGYVKDSIPCRGAFYLSTAKAGGAANIWLSADSTSSQALVSRNNAFPIYWL